MTHEVWDTDRWHRERGTVPHKRQDDGAFSGRIAVELPLPDKTLHPNGRTRSWQKRARLIKQAREISAAMCLEFRRKGLPWDNVTIQATFYMPRRRDGDGLNAWLKAYIDGLQDAGIVANDSGVTLLPPEQVTGAKERPRVVLTITPLGAQP